MLTADMTLPEKGTMPEAGDVDLSGAKVLVVEDEPGIAGFVRRGLTFEGFEVHLATDGRAALDYLRGARPDLLVLDLMLPGVNGLEILRRVRAAERAENVPSLPVILLTARDAIADRVTGLEVGADDYLVKPFAFEELAARVRALLRRTRSQPGAATGRPLVYGDLSLDSGPRTVMRGGRSIDLTPREFDLLALLLRNPNQVLTRAVIMDRVWGADFYGDSNVLEVFIANLRRELESGGEPRLIQTVRGVGYVLRAQG